MDEAPSPSARAEWLAARRKGIGGSDIAAIIWPHLPPELTAAEHRPFRTAIDVWMDKTGRASDDDDMNDAMECGILLEDDVATLLERREPIVVSVDHPDLIALDLPASDGRIVPYRASLDALGVDLESGLPVGIEYKTTNAYAADQWAEDMPFMYFCQVQWYFLGVDELDEFVVAVLIGGQRFRVYRVPRDPAFGQMLLDRATAFWHDHVLGDEPPALDGSDASAEVVRNLYPAPEPGLEVELGDPAADALVEEFLEAEAQTKEWNEKKSAAQNQLCALIGNAERAQTMSGWVFTYKAVNTKKFDAKAFAEAHPDLYAEFTCASSYRRWGKPKRIKS